MEEILVKLPAKSLLRFRCVCKSLYDLIESSSFINLHLKHHSTKNDCILITSGINKKSTCLLSFHSYESLSVVSPNWQIPYFRRITEVCGPCNGLLCILHCGNFVLCNPALREFKVMPSFPFERWRPCNMDAIGFGFDSITKDYKVVMIVSLYPRNGNNYSNKVKVYNLSTNSWREIDPNVDMPAINNDPYNGALFNGALHWIGESKGNHCILSFDMSKEVFRYMKLPNIDRQEEKSKHLMVLNESLTLWAYTDPSSTQEQQFVDIWIMRQYDVVESWTKQFILKPVTGLRRPLLWKNEAILLENLYRQLVSCSLDTHEVNFFDIQGEVQDILRVVVYQESLISIK